MFQSPLSFDVVCSDVLDFWHAIVDLLDVVEVWSLISNVTGSSKPLDLWYEIYDILDLWFAIFDILSFLRL